MISKKQAEARREVAAKKLAEAQAALKAAQGEFDAAQNELDSVPQPTADELKAAMEVIQTELDNFGQGGCLADKDLSAALETFGVDFDAFDEDTLKALSAALEYFGGDVAQSVDDFEAKLSKALEIVDGGEYTYIETAYDEGSLGHELLDRKLGDKVDDDAFDWVLEYFDCERLGKEIVGDTAGKFTNAGFFAAEAIGI